MRRAIGVTYKGNRGVGISYLLSSDMATPSRLHTQQGKIIALCASYGIIEKL